LILGKVSRKWLVNIPAEIRKQFHIQEGDYLVWEVDKKHNVIVVRVIKDSLKILTGKYSDPNLTYDVVEDLAERITLREINASNRTRHAHSPCK